MVVVPEVVVERPLGGLVLRDLILQRRERALELGVARLSKLHGIPSFLTRHSGCVRAPHFAQPPVATAAQAVGLVIRGILPIEVLMTFLRRVERGRRRDQRHDRLPKPPLEAPLRLLREPLLRRVVVEDRRVVLRPVVAELAVGLERIDVVPERVE